MHLSKNQSRPFERNDIFTRKFPAKIWKYQKVKYGKSSKSAVDSEPYRCIYTKQSLVQIAISSF